MGKVFKMLVVCFAVVGVLASAGVGYVYATNGELINQFWAVKDDFKAVPPERRQEVVAELPARITFEREVREDMTALPEERQKELYDQLAKSRDAVFAQFKDRIKAEAEIVRKATEAEKAVGVVTKTIEAKLGKVDVGFDLTGRSKAPKVDNLAGVTRARGDLSRARLSYGEAISNGGERVPLAVGVLEALDRVGDEVQKARAKDLSSSEEDRLVDIVTDAKATLYDMKQTPGLASDPDGRRLLQSVPAKLSK
jgi:hypothetical protein